MHYCAKAPGGLVRGQRILTTGSLITAPVGRATFGRIRTVVGEPTDHRGDTKTGHSLPIHWTAPAIVEQVTGQHIFITGIKVVDLLTPYQKMIFNLIVLCLCVIHIIKMLPATRIALIWDDNCLDVSGKTLLVFDHGGHELKIRQPYVINMLKEMI